MTAEKKTESNSFAFTNIPLEEKAIITFDSLDNTPRIKGLLERLEDPSSVNSTPTNKKGGVRKRGLLRPSATVQLDGPIKIDNSPDNAPSPRLRKPFTTDDEKRLKEEISYSSKMIELLGLIASYVDHPCDLKGIAMKLLRILPSISNYE